MKKILYVIIMCLFPMFAYAEEAKESVADKVAEFSMNKIDEAIQGLKAVAPQITDMAIRVAKIEAVRNVIFGFLTLGLAVLLLVLGPCIRTYGSFIHNKYDEAFGGFLMVLGIVLTVMGGFLFIPVFFIIGDYWNWVGIHHPDMYLVHSLLEHLTRK